MTVSTKNIATGEVNDAAELVNFLVGLPDDKVELGLVNLYIEGLGDQYEIEGIRCVENLLTDGTHTYDVFLKIQER